MKIKEITNKEEWENFLLQCDPASTPKTFLQSWNWGELQRKSGNKIWRLGIFRKEKLISVAFVYKISAKRAKFLFVPHGPVIPAGFGAIDKKEVLQLLLLKLREVAKDENASFIRISPLLERTNENEKIFSDLKFRNSPMHSSAYEATWKLDILNPEEKLLRDMRKTTRYLIKKTSENLDISIEKSNNPKDIAIYQKLNEEVSKRQKFVAFSGDFIKKEFETFNKTGEVMFLFGKHKKEVAAGAMVIFWSDIAFYHQAASLGEFSKLSIPYLLQWESIKEAKKRNCKIYDLWGFTDPEKFPKHPWAGPTLFKMGFGGYKEEYVKTQDFVVSKKYWINYIIELLRRKKRKL